MPDWAFRGNFWNVSRTSDELSVVCAEGQVPSGVKSEKGWRCFKVEGPLDLALVGIAAAITVPLAEAGINLFCMATFDTDYFLVQSEKAAAAVAALTASGHCTAHFTQIKSPSE